jgi:hypothetical protein
MMWEVGKSDINQQQSVHCNFDETHCYKAFNVPVIFAVSSNTGYTTGGQILTVTGHGFNNNKITAQVDGVDCVVLTNSLNEFTCKVQPKASVSVDGDLIGQHGLTRKFVQQATAFTLPEIETLPVKEMLHLHFESENGRGDNLGNKLSGWFKAPATTNVRFYMTCDDACDFDIARVADTKIDTTAPGYAPLMTSSSYKGYREYFDTESTATPTVAAAPDQLLPGY